MRDEPRNILAEIRIAVASAAVATDADIRAIYIGLARTLLVKLNAEAREVGFSVTALEAEMVRQATLNDGAAQLEISDVSNDERIAGARIEGRRTK